MANFLESDIGEIIYEVGDVAQDFAGRTVLLAGGRGFLGRYLTSVFDELNRSVLRSPCTVIVVDDLITSVDAGMMFPDGPHRRFIQHDVIQPLEFEGAVDYVVHAAGIASPSYYRAYALETLDVAVSGTRNLLEMAKRDGARFTFFSSSEIYGDPDPANIPTPETYRGNVSTQGQRACYDEGKRVGETLSYIFHHYFDLHTNVIRPFNVYGPGMQEHDYRVLPNFASRIKGGRPLSVYGSGQQTRTFCYITDALNGFLRVIARGRSGETYNIGTSSPEITMRDLVERIGAVLGRRPDLRLVDYPETYPGDEPMRRCPDISKARSQLGYVPRVDLAEGLARFLGWADENYLGVDDEVLIPARRR
jgi:UDP-glucuronate decarboxylase